MSYVDGYARGREGEHVEFDPLVREEEIERYIVQPYLKTLRADRDPLEDSGIDANMARVIIELDERVALKICDALGERFGWTADERDEALTVVLGAMAAGIEGA